MSEKFSLEDLKRIFGKNPEGELSEDDLKEILAGLGQLSEEDLKKLADVSSEQFPVKDLERLTRGIVRVLDKEAEEVSGLLGLLIIAALAEIADPAASRMGEFKSSADKDAWVRWFVGRFPVPPNVDEHLKPGERPWQAYKRGAFCSWCPGLDGCPNEPARTFRASSC